MKLIKSVIWIAGICVVLLFAANLFGHMGVAKAMESALGVPVKVKKINIDVADSQFGLYGLVIKSPTGFQESKMVSIPEILVQYDLSQILQRKVILKQVKINLDEVTVERGKEGRLNLIQMKPVRQLRDNAGKPAEDTPAEVKEPPVEVVIEEVLFSVGRGRYVDSSTSQSTLKEFPIEIKDAKLTQVDNPSAVVQQITLKVLSAVGVKALVPDFDQLAAGFGFQAGQAMEDFKKGVGDLVENIKGSFAR